VYKRHDFNNDLKEETQEVKAIIAKMVQIGLQLEAKLDEINKSAVELEQQSIQTLNTILASLAIIAIIVFMLISMLVANIVISSLNNFKTGLLSFFEYLNKKAI
jgi:methyl-accepting chemotaxis protein